MPDRDRPGPTVSLDEARRLLLTSLRRLTPRRVALDQSFGHVLAEAVVAAEEVPPFTKAAMDGFAVRAHDTNGDSTRLRLIGSVTAGSVAQVRLGPGEAMAIATGAPLPEGADAVCMIEHAIAEGDEVVLVSQVEDGENVRRRAEDIAVGAVVLGPATVIGPSHIALLSDVGVSHIEAYPRARVGVLSTGDELFSGEGPLDYGKIHDSNRHALLAAVSATGCIPINLGVVGDDAEAIARALSEGAGTCDAIVTSGGVSVGVADRMKMVLNTLSEGAVQWMEIAIKPGRPFGFGVLTPNSLPVICLPGNPVATMLSFELLARPALRFMMGHEILGRPVVSAMAEEPFTRRHDGKEHFVGARLRIDEEGNLIARPTNGSSARRLRSVAQLNAFAILPDGVGVGLGQSVRVMIVDADAIADQTIV